MTPESLEIRLRNDFGMVFRFEDCHNMRIPSENAPELNPEVVRRLPSVGNGISGEIDTAVCFLNGQNVLRLTVYPPTFDSGDRCYDSWHRLILYANEESGTLYADYYTGGYEVASAVQCENLPEIPEPLLECLKAAGILKNAETGRRDRNPGK